MVWQDLRARGGPDKEWDTPGNFVDWKASGLFRGLAAIQGWQPTLTGHGDPEPLVGEQVTYEYFDVLSQGTDHDLQERMFKMVDRESGRLLALRADITPQIARIVATRMRDDAKPLRLGYVVNSAADGRAGQLGVPAEQLFLLLGGLVGDAHADTHDEVPPAALSEPAHALPAQAHFRAHGRSRREADSVFALECGHFDFTAEDERRERQIESQDDVVALALEHLVLGHRQDDVEIAGRPSVGARVAFSRQPEPRARLDASRDVNRELLLASPAALPAARPARVLDDPALAAAVAARAGDGQEALREALPAPATADRAGAGPRSGRCTRPASRW